MLHRPDFEGIQKRLSWLIVIALGVLLFSTLLRNTLYFVSEDEIHPSLFENPIQEDTKMHRFAFSYRNQDYDVKPLAEYELWGLVVSNNNIKSFADIYHDEDSVDTKDLCVIWGDNLKNGMYREMYFTSGSFTCYYNSLTGKAEDAFDNTQISNNHLITENQFIRSKINDIKVGDQIYIKGLLVGYAAKGLPDRFFRNSSLTREDEGSGACEVIFVEALKTLKRSNEELHFAYKYSIYIALGLFLLKVILFFVDLHFLRFKSKHREKIKTYLRDIKPWNR